MLSEEKGIEAIIALQAKADIAESEEQAKTGWNGMSDDDKEETERAHKIICGGFKEEEKMPHKGV